MNCLVSVIVPIYNVEKFLNRCVDSIIEQTYNDLEIILVDDGSTDNSGKICDEYKLKDNRIVVIHKENGGLSDARNKGIEISKGEWLSFVDGDDCIEKDFIEILLTNALNNCCEISQCGYKRFSTDLVDDYHESNLRIIDSAESLKNIDTPEYMAVWNKIYKRELFNDIAFPKGRIHEDVATTYLLFDKAKMMVITDKKLYCYYVNNDGITKSKIKTNKLDLIDAYLDQVEYFGDKKYNDCLKRSANNLVALFGTLATYNKNKYQDYKVFKKDLIYKYVNLRKYLLTLPVRFDLTLCLIFSVKSLWFFILYFKLKKIIRKKHDS